MSTTRSVISPDGAIRVEYAPNEAGPSRWVFCPRVVHVPTGDLLLDLWDPQYWRWDASEQFDPPSKVTLTMRRYPNGGTTLVVTIDATDRTYVVSGSLPFDELRPALSETLSPRG